MRSLLLLLTSLFSLTASAQFPGGQGSGGPGAGGPGAGFPRMAIGRIYGKVLEEKSRAAVEFATVTILAANKDSVITGGLTKANGDFSIDKVPFGRFRLRIQYVGFKNIIQPVTVTPGNAEQDIGNLGMQPDTKTLGEVTITEERPTVIMGVDRRIYNVEKDITTRGGTGVDVMKNIPGLTVDVDGNVSLRNNSPTVFIDGRPSTLTLEQIPAEQIDRVEVITNPSAKFDAGSSGGIINVVLKKNTKPGYNGMIGANAGTNSFDGLNRYSLNGNLNIKEKSVNFFISYNLNYSNNITRGFTNRTNLSEGSTISRYNQTGINDAIQMRQFGRTGFDYTVNNRNTVTLSQSFMAGGFDNDDNQDFYQVDGAESLMYRGNRFNDQTTRHKNYTSQLMWKHTYPRQGKEWTADMTYNRGNNNTNSVFTTENYDGAGILLPNNPEVQRNIGSGTTNQYTAQFDFVNPITDTAKIEFGARTNYKLNSTGMAVTRQDASGEFQPDTFLSSDYRINDLVNALYVNYSNMFMGIGYQAGLRFEQTYFTGELVNKNQTFSYIYPDGAGNLGKALFPSLYLSKKFNERNEFQLNFSRKINRPGWMQIIPFIMFSDRQNYQIGNPSLAPEFINLAEANYNSVFSFGNWLTSAYLRYQENPVTNFVYRSETDSNVLISTFINGKSSISYGWENTLKFNLLNKKLDLTLSGNVFHTRISAASVTGNLENKGFTWNAKAMANYKLPAGFTVQVNGSYEAPRIIPQGKTREVYSIDLSLNKEITKKLSFNMTLNDVFNTRRFGSYYETDVFIQDLSRRRETRFLRVGLSYRFGEWDTSIFKRKGAKRGETPNMDQMEY